MSFTTFLLLFGIKEDQFPGMTYRPNIELLIEAFKAPEEWVLRHHKPGTSNLYTEAAKQFNLSHYNKAAVIDHLGWAIRLVALRRYDKYLAVSMGFQIVMAAHFAKYGLLVSPNESVVIYGIKRGPALFYQVLHRDNLWREVYNLEVASHSSVRNPIHRWGSIIKEWREIPPITLYPELIGQDRGPVESTFDLLFKSIYAKDRERLRHESKQVDQLLMFGK